MANPLNGLLYLASDKEITRKEVKKRYPCSRKLVNDFIDAYTEEYEKFRNNALGIYKKVN